MIRRLAALVEIEIAKLVRQPFPYVVIGLALAASLLSMLESAWRHDPENLHEIMNGQACFLQAASRGLSVASYLLLIGAALTISQEAGGGMFRLVFAKPVSRLEFFLAKGLSQLLLLAVVVWAVITFSYAGGGFAFGYGDVLSNIDPPIVSLPRGEMTGIMLRAVALTCLPAAALLLWGLLCSVLTDRPGFAVALAMGGLLIFGLLGEVLPGLHGWLFTSYLPPMSFAEIEPTAPLAIARDLARGISGAELSEVSGAATAASLMASLVCAGFGAGLFHRRDMTN